MKMLAKFKKQQRRRRHEENAGWHTLSMVELKRLGLFGRKDFPAGGRKIMKALHLVKVH